MVWAIIHPSHDTALRELIHLSVSERVVAILGGAMLDDALRRALIDRFRQKDGQTDMNEKLFRVGGPLGNLSPKIDMGYQLYMLDKPFRNAMHGIADIRNLFAHDLETTFKSTSGKMTSALLKLSLHEGKTHYPYPIPGSSGEKIEDCQHPKDKFMVNLKFCLLELFEDNKRHHRHTNIPCTYMPYEPRGSDGAS